MADALRDHREAFLPLVPPPERLTLDIGCGEGRLTRDLSRLGHRVLGIDASPATVTAAASVPGAGGWVAAGDAAALPVAGAVADCAVAFMSLQDIDVWSKRWPRSPAFWCPAAGW